MCLIVGFVGHGEQFSGPSPRLTRPAFKMGNVTKPEKPNVSDRLLTRKAYQEVLLGYHNKLYPKSKVTSLAAVRFTLQQWSFIDSIVSMKAYTVFSMLRHRTASKPLQRRPVARTSHRSPLTRCGGG